MRLVRYTYSITYVPGKDLITAGALSRTPSEQRETEAEVRLSDEVAARVSLVVSDIPATEGRLSEIRESRRQDEVCRQVMLYCAEGWPTLPSLPSVQRPYWQVQGELTIQQGRCPTSCASRHEAGHCGHASRGPPRCREVSCKSPLSEGRTCSTSASLRRPVGSRLLFVVRGGRQAGADDNIRRDSPLAICVCTSRHTSGQWAAVFGVRIREIRRGEGLHTHHEQSSISAE